jgi:hypothetical protein
VLLALHAQRKKLAPAVDRLQRLVTSTLSLPDAVGAIAQILNEENVATPGARITPKDHRLNPSSSVVSGSSKPVHRSDGHAGGDGRERPATDSALGKGEKTVLTAIAQYPDGALRDQLTVLTGYKRSSRDTYIQRLASAGLVDIRGNSVQATDAGVDALGTDFEPLPHGEELQQYWLNKLPEGERKILDILIQQFPSAVDRETLSEETGYKRSSRDTYLQRLSSRRLVENVGRGEVRASGNLFSEALV